MSQFEREKHNSSVLKGTIHMSKFKLSYDLIMLAYVKERLH